jgi:uncharacterized membrane protein YfcA
MKKHRFDVVSFIFGVTFVAMAFVLSFTHADIGERWIAWGGGAVLIAAGLALVFGSRSRLRDETTEED